MSFFAGFAGAGAQAYDQSLKQWRQLFQADEELEQRRLNDDRTYQLARDRLAFETEESAAERAMRGEEFDWRKYIDQARINIEQGDQAERWAANMYNSVLPSFDAKSPEDQLAIISQFDELFGSSPTGQGLAQELRTRVTSSDYLSPERARGLLLTALDTRISNPGQYIDDGTLDTWLAVLDPTRDAELIRQVEAFKGDNEEAYAGAVQYVQDTRDAELEETRIRNEATAAQAEVSAATADRINRLVGGEVELQEKEILSMDQALALGDVQVAMAQIDQGLYPQVAALNLRRLIADTSSSENQAAILAATVNEQIDMIVQEAKRAGIATGQAEEQLRFDLATSGFREAILSWQAVGAELSITELEARIAALNEDTTMSQFQREQARYEFVASMVESGQTEILETLGEDVLRPLFGDDWETVQDDLETRAMSLRDVTDRRVAAAALFEEYRADEQKFVAENAPQAYADEQDLRERGMLVSEGNLEVNRGQLDLANRSLAWNQAVTRHNWAEDLRPAAGTPNPELLDAAADYTRVTQEALSAGASEISGVLRLQNDLSLLADPELFANGNYQQSLIALGPQLKEWGIDPLELVSPDAIEMAAGLLGTIVANKTEEFVRDGTLFFAAASGVGGVVTPTDMGLNLQDPKDAELWNAIVMGQPVAQERYAQLDEASQAIAPEYDAVLQGFAHVFYGENGVAVTPEGAESAWNALVTSVGEDKLNAAGIEGPDDIIGDLRARAGTYADTRRGIAQYEPFLEGRGIFVDYNNPETMTVAAATINELARASNVLVEQAARLPVPQTLAAQGGGLGGLFAAGNTPLGGGIDPSLTAGHRAVISGIEQVFKFPPTFLMQEGFVTSNNGDYYITDPVELSRWLTEQGASIQDAANLLTTFSTSY